ncbi:MAG: hypothetical protein U0Q16_29795 [Bryobacteraceae bacterium]
MNILVPNLGSTSLKYRILEMPSGLERARGAVERVTDYRSAIASIPFRDHAVDAVAFKAVHGGPDYCGTYLIDDGVIAALERFLPAAPAHNAIYLAGIRAFAEMLPQVPRVAAFETEFHRTIPDFASRYGVPAAWHDAGVRRYGFHGASHQYVAETAPSIAGRPLAKLVSCHLGGSSSVCAISNGRSVDVTMGFSPQSGLESASRHGDLDAFAVLAMMQWTRHGAAEIRDQLSRACGLAALSGVPGGDLRDIEAAGTEQARMALRAFEYQVAKAIGAFTAAMSGLDAIAFTGGIGLNSARLRAAVCGTLGFLGVELDPHRNAESGDRVVSSRDSKVAVLAMATNEEIVVARRAYALLGGASARRA